MIEKYGRHEGTRTPDLYRVNNLHGPGRTPKLLQGHVRHNKTSLIVPELCIGGDGLIDERIYAAPW